eukprot:sb/3477018/
MSTMEEKPWDSQYQYQCKKKMFESHREELGDERATALANVWANYHFLDLINVPQSGCEYPYEALEAIKSWGPPPRNKMYEDKMREIKERDAVNSEQRSMTKRPQQKRQRWG